MRYARLWFLVAVVTVLLRLESISLEDAADPIVVHPVEACDDIEAPSLYVPLPPDQPFFSFLDQETGLWKGGLK